MLSNAYLLAKFRFDTAENEPAKNLQMFAKFASSANGDLSPPALCIARRRPTTQAGAGSRTRAVLGRNLYMSPAVSDKIARGRQRRLFHGGCPNFRSWRPLSLRASDADFANHHRPNHPASHAI